MCIKLYVMDKTDYLQMLLDLQRGYDRINSLHIENILSVKNAINTSDLLNIIAWPSLP